MGWEAHWRFADSATHNVGVKSGPVKFSSADKRSGTCSKRLKAAGKYKIYCSIHPDMRQTITVG